MRTIITTKDYLIWHSRTQCMYHFLLGFARITSRPSIERKVTPVRLT